MGKEIIYYVAMLLAILLIIVGVIIWTQQNINLILYKSKNIKEEDIKKYTKYKGISYITMGTTILPSIITGTININFDYYARFTWLIGFIIVYFINSKVIKNLSNN